jgi:hypothetical protein
MPSLLFETVKAAADVRHLQEFSLDLRVGRNCTGQGGEQRSEEKVGFTPFSSIGEMGS